MRTPNTSGKRLNSLRTRLILSAVLLTVIVLPTIGVALNNAFKQQVLSNVEEQLTAYLYSVLAVTEVENKQLLMPESLLENQFNVINSGLYALITSTDANATSPQSASAVQWASNSFLGLNAPERLPTPDVGQSEYGQITIDSRPHLIYSFSVRFATPGTKHDTSPLTLHIIKDFTSVSKQLSAFSQHLWTWLLLLMLVLIAIQFAWLAWTLKPLARFKQELKSVQQGESQQLTGQYPNELQAVARQLNTLLTTEQRQRSRYRNALSDLAHSLKTPLAVIQSQKDLSPTSIEQVTQINRTIGHQLKRAQTAAGTAWHLGVKVVLVSDKLLRTLTKIHPGIKLDYAHQPSEACVFFGDQTDLTEILGNLLDNACKAAQSQVSLCIIAQQQQLLILVEDDGQGVSPEQRLRILERGTRADTYAQGHGIGLAIVRDLVDSYQGELTIDQSPILGGARFQVSFTQPS
ncbi:two-component sensor histidine kinase [Shewanella colwelliana]|uniref:histidine kinase n=1 Tax=Shewanella colwelliana TaxID=23 RepID=A0ABQ4NZL5_SHECO|nr:ATP-binding protein [Shewanella colwelliana]GIU40564.1 two-component sensor histidine kinase [Shewanella colwelliana]